METTIDCGRPPAGDDFHTVKEFADCFEAGADDTNLLLWVRSLYPRFKECRNAFELVLIDLHTFRLRRMQPVLRRSWGEAVSPAA